MGLVAKKILITGIGGFVGSHCLEYFLKETDWEISGIDSFRHKGTFSRINNVFDNIGDSYKSRLNLHIHDLSVPFDDVLVKKIGNIDYIIDLASNSAVERSISDPVSCLKNNFEIGLNVLEYARNNPVEKLLHFSTDEVFGEAIEKPHSEWDTLLPNNPYCLHPAIKVQTPFGWATIKEFDAIKHRSVLTEDGYQKIGQKFEYDFDGLLRRIEIRNNMVILCTPEHRFYKCKNEEDKPSIANSCEIKAKDIILKDLLLIKSDGKLSWRSVFKINDVPYKGKVYDLEVPKGNNYVANYYVTHNSASKGCQDLMAISYWRTYNMPILITNAMNIVAERQDPEKFLPKLIQKLYLGQKMQIYADKDGNIGSRYYIYAKSVANALLFLLNRPVSLYKTTGGRPDRYNIVGDVELSNLEVAEIVANHMNKELKYEIIKPESSRPGYDKRYALDGSKMASLGWKAPINSIDAIKQIVDWTLRNPFWL